MISAYDSWQCQSTRAEIDRLMLQNAQSMMNAFMLQQLTRQREEMPFVPTACTGEGGYSAAVSGRFRRTRYSGNCPHCGAPVDAHAERCAWCDCYYD